VVSTSVPTDNPNIIGTSHNTPTTDEMRIHSNSNRMSVGGVLNKLQKFN